MENPEGRHQSRSYSLGHNDGLTPLQRQRFSSLGGYLSDNVLSEDCVGSDGALERTLHANKPFNEWEYNDILDVLGFGKVQWMLLINNGLMTMTCMAVQLAVGIIGISSQCEFNMTQTDKGIMMGASVGGIVISTYICGYICDILGRRRLLMWSMFITNCLQFVTMFVCNIWVFNFLNLLIGISLGGVTAALYPYLGEFISNKYRAVAINYSNLFMGITSVYVPGISWLILSGDWSWEIADSFTFKPWRLIILMSLVPGFFAALMLLFTPESPIFLLAQGKHEEALKALNWVARMNIDLNLEEALNTNYITIKAEELLDTEEILAGKGCSFISNIWKDTKDLFKKTHRVNVILTMMVMFGLLFASTGLQVWFPEIVNRSAEGSASSTICNKLDEAYSKERLMALNVTGSEAELCDDTINAKTYLDNIILGTAFVLGFTIQGAVINLCGRKIVLMLSLVVSALCGILLQFITNVTGILILFCLCILLPGISLAIMCGVAVDIVPTQLRSKSVSLGLTMSRLGVIVAANVIAMLLECQCSWIFSMITSVVIVCGCLVYFLPI